MAFAAAMPASGNFWVNHSWNADTTGDTDSYNVSVNGVDDSTTDRHWNVTYSAHDWQNITVYAFNKTDGLSPGIQQNTQIPNNPIMITGISNVVVGVGDTVHVNCNADDDDGDTPIFSCNRTDFTFDTETGIGSWTPSESEMYYVDFGVSDGYGDHDNATMEITVSDAATTRPPDPENLENTTGKYWVEYTWDEGDDGGDTDGYNVSLNGKWHNRTTRSINATDLDPSGWANISVWAYNKTGDGTLSAGSACPELHRVLLRYR